ncbi:SUMF1/EgtB/PvdO family nonheme iron enzyme, partial [candidate division CSSED10-310 bacterium]
FVSELDKTVALARAAYSDLESSLGEETARAYLYHGPGQEAHPLKIAAEDVALDEYALPALGTIAISGQDQPEPKQTEATELRSSREPEEVSDKVADFTAILEKGVDQGEKTKHLEKPGLARKEVARPADPSSPLSFPGFLLKGEIGRGGFGSVLLARELAAKRDVALKRFDPDRKKGDTVDCWERFVEEAYITAQLQHPGIVPIYTIAPDREGRIFYTMRPIEGQPLHKILEKLKDGDKKAEKEFPLRRLAQIMLSVCQTMFFAHERGVIHRDLKPANIIVGNYGDVLVIDWGLAKVVEKPDQGRDEARVEEADPFERVWSQFQRDIETVRTKEDSSFQFTMDGQILGTPAYMSPEQVRGRLSEIDNISDIWSIGIILYECATLLLPFEGIHQFALLHGILEKEPRNPVDANPQRRVPLELAEIINKCLEKDKKDRYESLKDLIVDLERWIEGIAPWRLIEQFDFTTMADGKPQGLIITQGDWTVKDGMLCGCDFGVVLTPKEIIGDLRIEVDAMVRKKKKGEISLLLSAPDPEKSRYVYDGYSMRIIAGDRTTADIHKAEVEIVTRDCDFPLDLWQTIVAERVGSTVTMERDGEELLTYRDFFPLIGNRTGLFSMGTGLRITGLRVFSRGSSLTLSCLDLARAFHNEDLPGKAHDYYTRIFSDHQDREEGVEALFRSGLLDLEQVKSLDKEKDRDRIEELLTTANELFERVEQSFFSPLGVLGKAMVYELRDEIEREIDELLRAFREYPDYDTLPVIPERLRIRQHVWEWETAMASDRLQAGIERLLRDFKPTWANQSPLKGVPVDTLDLSETITTIAGLKGFELRILNLSQTQVSDLSPLSGMPLKTLSLPRPISDISCLKGLPLEALDLSMTSVQDITALEQLSLKYLSLPAGVSTISPIRNFPLEHLDLGKTDIRGQPALSPVDGKSEVSGQEPEGIKNDLDIGVVSEIQLKVLVLPQRLEHIPPLKCSSLAFLHIPEKVSDISGLRGLSLRGIDLRESQVIDLSPLEGMPLEWISLPAGVSDISVLSGMPLRSLNLFHTEVRDLGPLQMMQNLEYLSICPGTLSSGWESIVRGLSGLKSISTDEFFTPSNPVEFWQLYDQGLLPGSRSELSALGRSRLEFSNSQGIPFRWVSPGVFLMGSPLSEPGREAHEKQHYVCLSHGFYMAVHPVRFRDFAEFIEDSGYVTEAEREGWAYTYRNREWGRTEGASWRLPGFDQSGDHPVVCVSWHDAVAYIEWLNTKEGRVYRLPTESEWEYSCRAGSIGPYHGELEQVCWHRYNSDDRSHVVCGKASNAWGLYDMHGNVWEWSSDWDGPYPEGFVVDPIGPDDGQHRVNRGGSWYYHPAHCRSAGRLSDHPSSRHAYYGFRLARDE